MASAVIINEASNAINFAIIFVFVDDIYFLLAHLHFKYVNNFQWYLLKQEQTTHYKQFSLKMANTQVQTHVEKE